MNYSEVFGELASAQEVDEMDHQVKEFALELHYYLLKSFPNSIPTENFHFGEGIDDEEDEIKVDEIDFYFLEFLEIYHMHYVLIKESMTKEEYRESSMFITYLDLISNEVQGIVLEHWNNEGYFHLLDGETINSPTIDVW